MRTRAEVNIRWVETREPAWTRSGAPRSWTGVDGIIVPGGFGDRGIEGMIQARRSTPGKTTSPTSASAWACRSLVMEFARDVLGYADANSQRVHPRRRATTSST